MKDVIDESQTTEAPCAQEAGVEFRPPPRPEQGTAVEPEATVQLSASETAETRKTPRAEGRARWEVSQTAEVEPWESPVDGAALLEEMAGVLKRYVVLPKNAAEALSLWVLHTYAFELREVSAYVGIESPEKRCGKTTLLGVLSGLVNRPVVAANISPPAFFRVIEETRPTLLIDEADTFLQGNDELRGILNSGYSRKTAYVVRVATRGANEGPGKTQRRDECRDPSGRAPGEERLSSPALPSGRGEREAVHTPGGSRLARFSCWCPKVMAAIGRLPETLADRCIVVRMERKTAREECEKLRSLDGEELRRKCARFVLDHGATIASARPAIPSSLNDRAGDIWEPLLALADLAGGDWPERARQAAAGLTANAQQSSPIGALLLDILLVFIKSERDRLFSRWMLEALNGMPNRPWAEARNGKPVTDMWLAQQLRPYGVRPKSLWIGEESGKGYVEADFKEVFPRYISREEYEAWKAEQGGEKG